MKEHRLFGNCFVFADGFPPCLAIAQTLMENPFCVRCPDKETFVDVVHNLTPQDLIIVVSRNCIRDQQLFMGDHDGSALVTNQLVFAQALDEGKQILFLSAHYVSILDDGKEQIEHMRSLIKDFCLASIEA